MQFDFTLTPDDLREASRQYTADVQQVAPGQARRGLIGWAVVAVLALAFATQSWWVPGTPSRTVTASPPPQNLWVAVLPGLLPTAFVGAVAAMSIREQARHARRVAAAVAAGRPVPPVTVGKGVVYGGVAVGLVLLASLAVWDDRRVAVVWHPTPGLAMAAAFAPWLAAAAVVAAVAPGLRRSAARRAWSVTPGCQRPLRADVSDAGVWASDGVCDVLYRWPAVIRYGETADLIVLTLEDARLLILPKRAVPDPADEDVLRGLVQTHVAAGAFRPRPAAFPVVAVTTPTAGDA